MKKQTLTKNISLSLLAVLFFSACGPQKGFEALGTDSASGSNSSASTGDSSTSSAYNKLEMSAFVSGTSYENEKVMALDKANNALLLYLPLPGSFANLYVDSTSIKGVKIQTVLDSQQKARVAVSIPLRLIVKDKVTTLPNAKLPSGDNLPMMPSGELPSLALGLNQNSDNKLYVYFGVNAVGMYVESSFFPSYLGITVPIKNAAGTRILGYFTIVPQKGNYKGGLFLSFILPNDISKIIDDHLSGIIN